MCSAHDFEEMSWRHLNFSSIIATLTREYRALSVRSTAFTGRQFLGVVQAVDLPCFSSRWS
jgi:hypothetical protein